MKSFIALCFLGVVAVTMAVPQDRPQILPMPPHPPRPLPNGQRPAHIGPELKEFMRDVRDFMKLYPRREIREVIRAHIKDPELRATMKFLRTAEFKEILHTIGETPEVQAISQYFENADWPWIHRVAIEAMHELEMETSVVSARSESTGGLSGLLDDVIAILPKEQLRALFDEKMENSDVFRSVIRIVSSEQVKTLISAARESSVVREQVAALLEHGIDMNKIIESKMALVGY